MSRKDHHPGEDSAKALGLQLRALRESRGVSQAALAHAIGVDSQTVSRWERHERRPNAIDYQRAVGYLEKLPRVGPAQTRAANPGLDPSALPAWIRHSNEVLLREVIRMGASDVEVDHVKHSLESPLYVEIFVSGHAHTLPRDQQEVELGLLHESLILWVRRHMEQRSPKRDGVRRAR